MLVSFFIGRPLDGNLLEELIGDGCQSDLDISDEGTEPEIQVPRLLDEDIPVQDSPDDDNSDPEFNVPLIQLYHRHQGQENLPPNLPPTAASSNNRRSQEQLNEPRHTQRSTLWRATNFTDKDHDYSTFPYPNAVKTPLQYLENYFNE